MGLAAALLALPGWAQSGAPAKGAATDEGPGTTIVGDRESPIGLYLTPWKNEYATRGMDRPAQIVQEKMDPIDPQVFKRQNIYYDTIQEYRQAELGGKR
jgi:hypothetical protein